MADFHSELADTFDHCDQCETWVVHLPTHTCPSDARPNKPTRAERVAAADRDARDDADPVLIVPARQTGSARAYHEIDECGDLVCGGPGTATREAYITVTRQEAKQRRRAPCKRCRQR